MPDPKVRDILLPPVAGLVADMVAEVREVTAAGRSHGRTDDLCEAVVPVLSG